MGKIVVTEFITLDGVVDDPGGAESFERGGWAFRFQRGEEGDRFKLDELFAADAQLLGRATYDGFAAAWPSREDPVGFADRMNTMPKYVVSSTLRDPEWANTQVISLDDVASLRDRYERDILVAGSIALVHGLLERGLVDELRLMIFPVVLGAGRRLFAEGAEHAFTPVDVKRSTDVTILTLARSAA